MIKCSMCSKENDDSRMFCPICGRQLTAAIPTSPKPNPSPSWFKNWDGVLLTLIGYVVAVLVTGFVVPMTVSGAFAGVVSIVFVCILPVVGIISGWSSPNKINKILSVIVGGITILLSILSIILHVTRLM